MVNIVGKPVTCQKRPVFPQNWNHFICSFSLRRQGDGRNRHRPLHLLYCAKRLDNPRELSSCADVSGGVVKECSRKHFCSWYARLYYT